MRKIDRKNKFFNKEFNPRLKRAAQDQLYSYIPSLSGKALLLPARNSYEINKAKSLGIREDDIVAIEAHRETWEHIATCHPKIDTGEYPKLSGRRLEDLAGQFALMSLDFCGTTKHFTDVFRAICYNRLLGNGSYLLANVIATRDNPSNEIRESACDFARRLKIPPKDKLDERKMVLALFLLGELRDSGFGVSKFKAIAYNTESIEGRMGSHMLNIFAKISRTDKLSIRDLFSEDVRIIER